MMAMKYSPIILKVLWIKKRIVDDEIHSVSAFHLQSLNQQQHEN